jgi:hypothetical protein
MRAATICAKIASMVASPGRRLRSRWVVLALAAGVAVTYATARPAGAAAAPVQLVVAEHPVVALSASEGYVAWRTRIPQGSGVACTSVHRLHVRTGRAVTIRRPCQGLQPCCEQDRGGGVDADGSTVFWKETAWGFSGGQFDPLVENSVSEYPELPRTLQATRFQHWCGGDQISAAGAGGGSLAYSVLHYDEVDPGMDCAFSLPDGDVQATGGAIRVVSGGNRTPQVLAGALPSGQVAAAGGLVATVPYSLPSPVDRAPAVAGVVEIWDVGSATRVATISPSGSIVDIDFNGRVLAVLVRSQGRERLIRYDATGAKLGSMPLATSIVQRISMGAAVIAYAVGLRIVELGTVSGAPRTLWRTTRPPRLVTVAGGHVLWVARGRRILSIAA